MVIFIQTKVRNRYLLALIIIKSRIAKMAGILCQDRVIQLRILIQIKSDISQLILLKGNQYGYLFGLYRFITIFFIASYKIMINV